MSCDHPFSFKYFIIFPHFTVCLHFVSFFSSYLFIFYPFAFCLALILIMQISIAFLSKKKTLPSSGSWSLVWCCNNICRGVSCMGLCASLRPWSEELSHNSKTKTWRIKCKQSLKSCSFSMQQWRICGQSLTLMLPGFHFCSSCIICYSHIGCNNQMSICIFICGSIGTISCTLCVNVYIVTTTHHSYFHSSIKLYERSLLFNNW